MKIPQQEAGSSQDILAVPWSKVAILGMVIPPLTGNPYNGYINPYCWVHDHPLLYVNIGRDPSTAGFLSNIFWNVQPETFKRDEAITWYKMGR